MKNNKKPALFLVLAMICLLAIGGVLASGIIKNRPKEDIEKESNPQILGEATQDINQFVQNTVQNTKEKVVEKVKEAETIILETINKEVQNLTQSQIDALKLQICRDLGVITAAPTQTP